MVLAIQTTNQGTRLIARLNRNFFNLETSILDQRTGAQAFKDVRHPRMLPLMLDSASIILFFSAFFSKLEYPLSFSNLEFYPADIRSLSRYSILVLPSTVNMASFKVKAVKINGTIRLTAIKVFDRYHPLRIDHPVILGQLEKQIRLHLVKPRSSNILGMVILNKSDIDAILTREIGMVRAEAADKISELANDQRTKTAIGKTVLIKNAEAKLVSKLQMLKSINEVVNRPVLRRTRN